VASSRDGHQETPTNTTLRPSSIKAARRAGYSERTAGQMGYEILNRPEVASRIDYLTEQFWQAFSIGPKETAARIAMAARPDIRLLFNEDGSHKKPHELCDQAAAMVISCDTELVFDDDGAPPTAVRKTGCQAPVLEHDLTGQGSALAPIVPCEGVGSSVDARVTWDYTHGARKHPARSISVRLPQRRFITCMSASLFPPFRCS
jgi:ribosomal protein L34